MEIKPLFDRVLCAPQQERVSAGGIYIPLSQTERSQIMTVIASGGANCVKSGDRVVVNKYSGAEVNIDGTKQYIVKVTDILGVIYE
jgi:co-chaperonin GroES (HSP10)